MGPLSEERETGSRFGGGFSSALRLHEALPAGLAEELEDREDELHAFPPPP
jgi:hypothetical protein